MSRRNGHRPSWSGRLLRVTAVPVIISSLLVVLACAMSGPALENPSRELGPWKRFTHPTSGYSVSYPSDWRLAIGPKGNLTILNFPRERGVHGVVLPEHGAEIGISIRGFHGSVVGEWIREDLPDEYP